MKIKKILLLAVILLITGCDVEYNIHFSENTITEKTKLILENKESNNELFKHLDSTTYHAIINANQNSEYKKIINETNNYKNYIYQYDFSYDEYKNTRFKNCYDAYTITNDNNNIKFNTSNSFKCMVYDYMPINKLTINITSDYKVISHNADEVTGNIYKWHINNQNKAKKPINISFDKTSKLKSQDSFVNKNQTLIIILALSLPFIIILIKVFININNKKKNEM